MPPTRCAVMSIHSVEIHLSAIRPAAKGATMEASGMVPYIHPVCLPLIFKGPSNRAARTGDHAPQIANSRNIIMLMLRYILTSIGYPFLTEILLFRPDVPIRLSRSIFQENTEFVLKHKTFLSEFTGPALVVGRWVCEKAVAVSAFIARFYIYF